MSKHVCMQTNPGPQKAWSSPKLKKIDIETITANSVGGNTDGPATS